MTVSKDHMGHVIDYLTIGQMRDVLREMNDNDLSLREALSFVIFGNYNSYN